MYWELGSSVSIVTSLRARPGSDSLQGQGRDSFLFASACRSAHRPTQLLIQWVPGSVLYDAKSPGRFTHHSHAFGARVWNTWSFTSTPHSLHGVMLRRVFIYMPVEIKFLESAAHTLFSFAVLRNENF